MSNWFNYMKQRVAIGTSQKVGFGTLNRSKNEHGALKRPYPMFDRRIWLVRDPFSRFKSLYCYIQEQATLERLVSLREMSPEELLQYIHKHWGEDAHWRSQCDHLGEYEAQLVPLERLGEILPDAPRRNVTGSTKKLELSLELEEDVYNLYADDFLLWVQSHLEDEQWQTRKPITIKACPRT